MRDFKELKVWQKAHQLVLAVYRDSTAFPTEERFGITAHLQEQGGRDGLQLDLDQLRDLAALSEYRADRFRTLLTYIATRA